MEEKRKISYDEGNKFNKEYGLNLFLETSAKTGFNAQKIFIEAENILYEENLKYKERASNADRNNSNNDIEFGQDNQLIIKDDNYVQKRENVFNVWINYNLNYFIKFIRVEIIKFIISYY